MAAPRRDQRRSKRGASMAKRTANGETASAQTRDRLRAAFERARIVRILLRPHTAQKRPVTLPTLPTKEPCSH